MKRMRLGPGALVLATMLLIAGGCGDDGGAPTTDPEPDVVIPDSECQYHSQCEELLGSIGPCQKAACNGGTCELVTKPTWAECDDAQLALGECERGVCNQAGTCTATSADDGTSCNQAMWNACTGFQCMGGTCSTFAVEPCDDANPCTDDSCDSATGCQHTANTHPCNDLNPCTGDDVCGDGVCLGATDLCECDKDKDCAAYDDGDKCNGVWGCFDGVCAPIEKSEVTCAAGQDIGQCEVYGCNPANGKCELQDAEDYIACDDGDVCTGCPPGETCAQLDFCQNGVCKGGKNNPCSCDADADCADFGPQDGACGGLWLCNGGTCAESNAPAGTACDDGDPCTAGDLCVAGACISGTDPGCPTCQDYCASVQAACTGDLAQYASVDACVDYCESWAMLPLGDLSDTSGNTVGCRIYHAGAAAADPALHCDHAGPTGGNVCGTWCDNYCQLAQANCTGGDELYADGDACNTACADLEMSGAAGDTSGDSVQCRIYHLGVAGSPDGAATHCPHGAVDGGGVCVWVDPCLEMTCDDGDLCTDDGCDSMTGECTFDAVVCDDGDLCTTDACDAGTGQCAFDAVVCDDGDLCTTDACDAGTGQCTFDAVVCDDGDLCTTDACDAGTGQCTFDAVDCDDQDAVTVDACDPADGQCTHT